MQSKENLRRITFELFEDAAKENVKYMEVRFAPLLHTLKGLRRRRNYSGCFGRNERCRKAV